MKFFLFFTLFLFVTSAQANCRDKKIVQRKISQLKLEVSCISSESLHDCADFLNSRVPLNQVTAHRHGSNCEMDHPIVTSPIAELASKFGEEELLMRKYHGNWYVNSVEDFYEHTRLHIERVQVLGSELLRSYPELFSGLTPEQVRYSLAMHDRAKLSPMALSSNGRPFYLELYEKYRDKPDMKIIHELNAKDEKWMNDAYRLVGLDDNPSMSQQERARRSVLREKLKRIERIADLVDRGQSPVATEEFGRPMKAASLYFDNEQDRRIARELEGRYKKLTSHLEYKVLTPAQRNFLGREMKLEARFAMALRNENVRAISARAMTAQFLKVGKSGFLRLLGGLGSAAAKKLFLAADFLGLYFGDMDNLGCSGIGYHDWVKNPNCEPAIGLTPRFVEFLNEDISVQMAHLNTPSPTTCQVLNKTYEESLVAPKVKSCSSSRILMEIGNENVSIDLNERGRIREINLNNLGHKAPQTLHGVPRRVFIDNKGEVSKLCYVPVGRDGMTGCLEDRVKYRKELFKMNDFIKSLNYQMQKAIHSCLNS